MLVTQEDLNNLSPSFLLTRAKFAEAHPDLVVTFLKVYEKARLFEKEHFDEAVSIYAKAKRLDEAVVANALKNNPTINLPISDEIIASQQKTADFQYDLKFINKKIDVREVVDNQYIEKALKK